MTDEQCIEIFDELSGILGEQGLGWLVQTVTQEIQEGQIETAVGADLTDESAFLQLAPEYRRSIKKEEFLVRREYSPAERLRLLIDAIGEVVYQANDIEQYLPIFFRENRGPKNFQFSDRKESTASTDLIRKQMERPAAVQHLQALLEELRQEITR